MNTPTSEAERRAHIRADLAGILEALGYLQAEAETRSYAGDTHGGPPLGGEAMVHLGPTAPWALEDDTDPIPAVELTWWEYAIRQALNSEPPPEPSPLEARIHYISRYLEAAGTAGINLHKLAHRARSIRIRLEDQLGAGLRDQHGVPCLHCGKPLIRRMSPSQGLSDDWECSGCQRALTAAQYWVAVRETYRQHAPALTADELAAKLGVRPNLIRVWGARGWVAKRGRNLAGHTLYDVDQATRKAQAQAG